MSLILTNDSYYGGFRSRTFSDVFPTVGDFQALYDEAEIPQKLANSKSIPTIYYLLYARYGNSHISYSDENQFKYALLSKIFMYGPSWEKRLDIQDKIRALTEQDIMTGGKAIYNHAFNPGTPPSTDTLEELTSINDQNTSNFKKSKLDGYSALIALIETDVTESFISKFKDLFIKITAPDYPLLYQIPEGIPNE
jgi:hypothetical protein